MNPIIGFAGGFLYGLIISKSALKSPVRRKSQLGHIKQLPWLALLYAAVLVVATIIELPVLYQAITSAGLGAQVGQLLVVWHEKRTRAVN